MLNLLGQNYYQFSLRKDQNSKIEKTHETQKSDIGNSDNKSNKCEI